MSTKYAIKQLKKLGLTARPVTMTEGREGIIVEHGYTGPYPDLTAMLAHNAATGWALKQGLYSEQRGHYTGTLIVL